MKIHYALYDKATDTGGAKYWTWFEPPLTFELLDRFYGNFAVHNLPDLSKADLAKFPFSGGIVHIADTDSTQKNGWIVLYRSFYGGERDRGRHGTVLLTAWIRVNETFEALLPVFSNETFNFVEQHSKDIPVPAPAALTERTGENLSEKWQKGLEKFAPYITSRFDSHLKILDNPTGLQYDQSSAFVKDRAEWEAEHVDKETALAEQASALTANVTSLQSHLQDARQRLSTSQSDLEKTKRDRDKFKYGASNRVMQFSAVSCGIVFIMMFFISSCAPNWSVNILKSINPFPPSLEKQITKIEEKMKGFGEEKAKLEAKKKELEAAKQKKDEEKQKKGKDGK
jgi:hypothetical protein